jgi:hypothetical protein
MRDEQDGTPRRERQQLLRQLLRGLIIQVLGGLVEDQHRRVGQQAAGQRQPAPLAAGEPFTVLADARRQAVG